MNIEKIAKLANLKLSKKEELKFQKEMEAILKYIDKLNELKIDPIKPSSFINNLENIMYEDKETKTLSIPALLIKEAIKSKNGYIVAPKVLKQ